MRAAGLAFGSSGITYDYEPARVHGRRDLTADGILESPDPRRERIAERLRQRVGGNAEDFYRDACRLVEGSLVLEAGSHLLGHCAREIESAVREVLVALLIASSEQKMIAAQTRETKSTQRAEVEEVARRLALPTDAPEVDLWLQLADPRASAKTKGLHAIAHRHAHRHAPPIDDDIREMWRRFESLLAVLLRELEARFVENLPKIRELAQRAEPGEQSVKDLNKLPNTLVLRTAFYEDATPGWLAKLDEAGFFDEVSRPVVDVGTGSTYLQPSPAITYLARMLPIPEQSDRVLTIIDRIPIPHEFAERDLLRAAEGLDPDRRRRYARHLVQFIRSQQGLFLLGVEAADFAAALAAAGDTTEAASLLEELLVLRTDPRAAAGEGENAEWSRPKPIGRLDEHDFERAIERGVPALTQADPILAFHVLLPLVEKALEVSERPGLVAEKADLSVFWMPDLSQTPERYGKVQAALLAQTLRKAALAAVAADPAGFDEVIAALDASGWTVCRRIALDVLDRHGDVERIRVRLIDSQRFARDRDLREFDAIAAHQLGSLAEDDRREFVRLMEAQVALTHYVGGEPIEPEHAALLLQAWKADLVCRIIEHLPNDLRARYADISKAAEPAHAPAPTRPHVSPLDAQQIAAMSNDDVVVHLKNWKPSESVFDGPTLDAQAAAFREAVLADPPRFIGAATTFGNLDPTYVRTFFDAVRELVDKENTAGIAWEGVFDLALSAIAHKVQPDEGMGFGRDPGWGWTRKEIADILRVALSARPRRLPYDKRDRVRELIELLAEDERAATISAEGERPDALSASLNTTRGSALHAALEYVAWVADETGATEDRHALAAVPEIRQVLERHVALDNDPSVAARGAFGFHLSKLLWYDEDWTATHRGDLFPAESPAATELTWQAFVVWHHVPPQRALELFTGEYHAAVERISSEQIDRRERVEVDEALAHQFAHALIRGWISLDSADGLLAAFYSTAPARIRADVLEFLGRIIEASPGEQLKPNHCARVQALWERRRAAAAELELAERRPELEAFGWLFVTGRCDPEWMLRELIATLELTGSIEPDSKVMDKLKALAPASPVEAVRAVDLLTESPKERWFVQASLEEIQVILRNGLADKRSREAARRLVNRLYADGQGAGLVQLLDEPSANT